MQYVSRLSILGSKVGGFGIIGLLWTSISGFVSFQQILDIIWGIHQQRSFVKQYLVGLSMLGILLSLTIISSLVSTLTSMLIPHVFTKSNLISWLAPLHEISFVSFPLLLFLTCYFCYRFLPSYTLNNAYLLIGALVSTLAIYVSQEVFVWYAVHLLQFELIYGSLAFIMLFTFWFYIVCIIVLFGAEVAVALQATVGPQKVKD
jgi:membrane protein